VLLLALDTATPALTVALHDGSRALAGQTLVSTRKHGELLAAMIEQVLAAGGASRGDLEAVAVGTGPGPYTGLRAGLVTARVLASALGIPAVGVCTLDVIARSAVEAAAGREFLVASDARRKEVYWARYAPDGQRLAGPYVNPPGAGLEGNGASQDSGCGTGRQGQRAADPSPRKGAGGSGVPCLPQPEEGARAQASRDGRPEAGPSGWHAGGSGVPCLPQPEEGARAQASRDGRPEAGPSGWHAGGSGGGVPPRQALPVAGEGPVLYPEMTKEPILPVYPDAAQLAVIAAEVLASGGPVGPPEPLYLRRPDAQVPGKPKRVTP
jgi:tRNA threonylcarbamoyl adenosine modification protein YeaZ